MASVDSPKYGIKIQYTNGSSTVKWFRTQEARDRAHARLNRDPSVRTAKRVQR